MRNFLIALLIAGGAFALGTWIGRTWVAGIPTSLFGFLIAYFILVRRSFGKLNKLVQGAMAEVQQAQGVQDPNEQLRLLDRGIEVMTKGLALAKEQFLMDGILKGQIGSLHYQAAAILMQLRLREEIQNQHIKSRQYVARAKKRYTASKGFLEEANKHPWQLKITRNWQAMGMLAALNYRDGEKDLAIERMKKVRGPGSGDPLYWGVLAWMMHENGSKSDALLEVNSGLDKNGGSEALREMANSIQNQEGISFIGFGMNWFMFFPEHLTPKVAMKLQSQMDNSGGANQPMNRAMRRKMKRQK